jgi:hypothetical protein
MRLFGILLIVANLIAGGAFVYLATQDWQGRQRITARGLQHLLLLQGLPLEGPDLSSDPEGETPFVVEMGGGESTKTISKKLLENYFQTVLTAAPAAAAADPAAPAAAATGGPSPLLPAANQTVVTNQLAEVKRVRGLVDDRLKDGTADEKARLLRGWLLYQAENFELRSAYLQLLSVAKVTGAAKTPEERAADIDKAKEQLLARFDAVISAPDAARAAPAIEIPDLDAPEKDVKDRREEINKLVADEEKLAKGVAAMPADEKAREALKLKRDELRLKREESLKAQKAVGEAAGKGRGSVSQSVGARVAASGSDGDRRVRLAHLLVHLDPDPAWQKRVSVVVGLRRYVRAIADQVPRFKSMIDDVEQSIPGDQAVFARHEAQLRELATQNSDRARTVAEQKQALANQKNREDDAVKRQETQRNELKALLERIKQQVDELLVQQTSTERQLFEVQREVGLTLEEVYRLEALLAATERERFGLPPRP